MDDSFFARFGHDPVRIFTHFYGPPAPGGVVRLGGPARAEEAPGDGSAPASVAGADRPPGAEEGPTGSAAAPELPAQYGEGAAAPAADGGDTLPGAEPGDSFPHPAANGAPTPQAAAENLSSTCQSPPSSAGEAPDAAEVERRRLMSGWLSEHWEIVEAMARTGEAPQRPAPPPAPTPPEPDAAERPFIHVARGDRWNKWKMAEFLRQLAATHSVTAAARAVGMSRNSAYKLRTRLKGQPFDIAWEAAFRHGYDDLPHAALELALEGEEVPHYYQGVLVGTHRKRNPQLIMALLKMRNSAGAPMLGRYGAAAEFWSEHWQQITHRVETGSVTWSDEHEALSDEERARLDLPDEKKIDQIIIRNLPDEPRGRFGR